MDGKQTQMLMESLKNCKEIDQVLEKTDGFAAQPLAEALEELLAKKRLTRAQVIRDAMLNEIYGHQIFHGVRTPSRDKLIAIGFGMKLTFEEMDELLKKQGYARLYARNERDAIIIYGLLHDVPLMDVNTTLYEKNMETLG